MDTGTLAQVSNNLVYSSIAVYALAMLAYAAETAGAVTVRRRAPRAPDPAEVAGAAGATAPAAVATAPQVHAGSSRLRLIGAVGTSFTVLAFLLNVAGAATRGVAAGRVPWGNMYEFVLVCAIAAGGAYLAFLTREPVRAFGVWIVGIVLLALGLAVTVLYVPAGDLVPVLDSYWLVIHVAAAIAAGGVFTLGAVASALFLLRHRAERRNSASRNEDSPTSRPRYAAILPASERLEQVTHAAHIFAFPVWTFAVIAGAIWAENSWGRYWGWDPKETWAFITWVLYAAHLHAQATAGWRGVRASWLALAGYAAFLFNFFGVNLWITGLHSYAGV